MRYLITFLIFVIPIASFGQLTITSVSPANGTVNVPLNTTIVVNFNQSIDTTKGMAYTNITEISGPVVSNNRQTISGAMTLSPNTAYFIVLLNFMTEAKVKLEAPYITYFTTGATFPSNTISGIVNSGESGVSPAKSIVFITYENPMQSEDEPAFVMATLANNDGTFTIPYCTNGKFYILAAKDVDGNEGIELEQGNVITNIDSVTVNNANVTGVSLTFLSKKSFSAARDIANNLSIGLPAADSLRKVEGYHIDTTGKAMSWDFLYVKDALGNSHEVSIDIWGNKVSSIDPMHAVWLIQSKVFNVNLAADATVFINNVENAGGREYRRRTPVDGYYNCNVTLGDLSWTYYGQYVQDYSKPYWVAEMIRYWWVDEQWYGDSKIFIGDFTTGQVLFVTSVKDNNPNQPNNFTLHQNYPNPFNPATVISYRLSTASNVILKVYDLLGREIATLVNEQKSPGIHSVTFDASNLPSGIYIYRLQAGKYSESKKMILMK